MVENDFEKILEELVKEGKEQGYLTYEQIAKKTIDLNLDANDLDKLYNTLMENSIEVRAEDEEGGADINVNDEIIIDDVPDESKDMSVNDNVRMYLKEIGKISLLSMEEEQELYKLKNRLDTHIKYLIKNGKEYAKAYRDYRVELAKELIKLKDEGYAIQKNVWFIFI